VTGRRHEQLSSRCEDGRIEPYSVSMSSSRAAALHEEAGRAAGCTRCALHVGRTQVVFGEGDPDAALALVGEAPGFHEDREGMPFAGRARELLERLLGGVGLSLDEVYLATVLKCRPPGNRDPLPEESAACEPYLYRQLELVRPRVVGTLGSFATALLSGRALGITRVHGQEQEVTLGGRRVTLYPLYHPAAALYTPTMLDVLERDVARLSELLSARGEAPCGDSTQDLPLDPELAPTAVSHIDARERQPVQLGLF